MHGSSSYRRSFGPESVEEVKNNINSTHEEFLLEDDPIKKADLLRYMSMYAMQFLHLVPHDKKFLFKETERVLHHSSMNISDFDPREGSVAFEYLARYAHNILDQPWRTDFHTIKLTSGFYVHNISSQLKSAHEILVAMGYVHVDEVTLKVVPNLDAKKLKAVSRDMIVASQECLILSQIWQRVADQEPDYPLTIGEVFEFRRAYLGDTDTICKTMLSDIRRRNHEAKIHQANKKTQHFVPVDKLIEYEGMDADVRDRGVKPEKEVDLVENVLRNTRLMHDEHIYDPVYSGGTNGHGLTDYTRSQLPYSSSNSSFPSNENSAFVPNRRQSSQPYYSSDMNYGSRYRDSVSPMIPKTVSNFCSNHNPYVSSNHSISNSSSMSSLSLKQSRHSLPSNQPLKFSKIPPAEEEAWQDRRGSSGGKQINWSEYYGPGPGDNSRVVNEPRKQLYDKVDNFNDNNSRSRKPIMPGDVYPDDYFPRVVKPTPIHSTVNPLTHYNKSHQQMRYLDDNSEDDVMNEALEYQSEINGLDSKCQNGGDTTMNTLRSERSSQATSALSKGDWETDSRSLSSEISRFSGDHDLLDKRSSTSTEASSWDGESTILRQKCQPDNQYHSGIAGNSSTGRSRVQHSRPSQIEIPNYSNNHQNAYSESSPDSLNENVNTHQQKAYRESSKGHTQRKAQSSSSASPKSPLRSPREVPTEGHNENLQSLDAVYYDFLLKKGRKDTNNEEYDPAAIAIINRQNETIKSSKNRETNPKIRCSESSVTSSGRSAETAGRTDKISSNTKSSHSPGSSDFKIRNDASPSNYNAATNSEKPVKEKRIEKNPDSAAIQNAISNEIPPLIKIEPWSCRFCTFRNTKAERVCEICAKSKDFFEEEPDPALNETIVKLSSIVGPGPKLYSQAVQTPTTEDRQQPQLETEGQPNSSKPLLEEVACPQCTLLNNIRVRTCDACGFRLIKMESPKFP